MHAQQEELTASLAQHADQEGQSVGQLLADQCRQSGHALGPLPSAGITLIQLATSGTSTSTSSSSHWNTAVPPLVHNLINDGRAVFYVETMDVSIYHYGRGLTDMGDGSPLLRCYEDQDLVVYAGPVEDVVVTASTTSRAGTDRHGRRCYACSLPTLYTIKQDLAEHEKTHGDAVVIFEDALLLRPYFAAGHPEFVPTPLDISKSQAAGWRAADMLEFAQARRGPTVLVYDAEQDPELDLEHLISVSRMHVIYDWTPGRVTVKVIASSRAALSEPWTTSEMVVPAIELDA